MRSFAPCLVVMLAGLALGMAGGFAWVTGDAYTGEHTQVLPRVAVVGVRAPSITTVPVTLSADDFPPLQASGISTTRGGEAT